MRVLVITPFLAFPGTDGGATVMFNTIKNLSSRHEVVYLSFARCQDLAQLQQVVPYCLDMVTVPLPGGAFQSSWENALYLGRRLLANVLSLATFTPVVVQKCHSRAMMAEVHRTIERYRPDVIHVFFPQMAQYVEACAGVPAVMDTSDVALVGVLRRAMSARNIWGKAYYLMQWLFWVRYEARYFPHFGKVLTVTQQDAAALKMVLPQLDVYTDAIAIDLEPIPETEQGTASAGRIGFLASFGHQPNVDAALYFVREVLPAIRQRLPQAEFLVAGKNPPAALLEMKGAGVTCLGFVSDVPSFYRDVEVVVAPIRFGGGIKLKVLEAMACGKPVVTTSVGAEGIAGPDDESLLIADAPASFADAVLSLLADRPRREALGERARQLIERRFSWRSFLDDLDGIYADLVRAKR